MGDMDVVDVLVEFDYEAEEKDELTLHIGDIVRNVTRSDGGWWEGEFNGNVGVFPDNFVKVIEAKEDNAHKKDSLPHHARKEEGHGHQKKDESHHKKDEGHKRESSHVKEGSHVKELKNVLLRQPGSIHGPGPALPGVVKRNRNSVMKRKKFAKVAYSYTPENQDELRLDIGDVVEILNEEEEGWWRGALRGQQGMFPSNFVEMIKDPPETDENDKNEKKEQNDEKLPVPGEVSEIKGKKIKGVGYGNIFGNEEIKLRSASLKEKSSSPQDETPPRPLKPRVSVRIQKALKAKVLFGYQALNEDELTLEEGETITVLDREIEDSGWWLGEVHGRRGVFPDNFVDLLPQEEAKPRKPPPPSLPVPAPAAAADNKKINKPLPSEPKSGTLKKDAHERSIPPMPGRKPDLPPPMKKPPPKPEQGKPAKIESELDVIESHENLKSLTSSRPKNPNKRPPSMELLHRENGDAESDELPWMNDKSASLGRDVKQHVEAENEKNKGDSIVRRAAPPHPRAEPRAPSANYERPLTIIGEPSSSNNSSRDIEEFRHELQHLKENTVSKVAYNELHTEVKSMREQLDKMRQTFDKRLYELMNELDEEKKIRLSTQVEMERIRKLHMQST